MRSSSAAVAAAAAAPHVASWRFRAHSSFSPSHSHHYSHHQKGLTMCAARSTAGQSGLESDYCCLTSFAGKRAAVGDLAPGTCATKIPSAHGGTYAAR